MINAFAHHRSIPHHAPNNHRPNLTCDRFEIDWANQFPNQVIPLEHFFPERVIPDHPERGMTEYRAAKQIVDCAKEVLSTKIPDHVKNNDICGKGLASYEQSFHNGAIVCCIHGVCFGWRQMHGPTNNTLDILVQRLDTLPDSRDKERRLLYFDHFVLKIVEYLLKCVVPHDMTHVSADSLMKGNVENVRTHQKKKKGRCALPIWTEGFARTHQILGADRTICNGHYWPFAKLFDRVIPNFFQAFTTKVRFYAEQIDPNPPHAIIIDDIDVDDEMRDCIENRRFYPFRRG